MQSSVKETQQATIVGSTNLVTPNTGGKHKTSAASLVLFGKDNNHGTLSQTNEQGMQPFLEQAGRACARLAPHGGSMKILGFVFGLSLVVGSVCGAQTTGSARSSK